MNFDDPRPVPEKRSQQMIYLKPSLRQRIDMERASTRESRSAWIERAIEKMLKGKEKP
jgi:hypothetical protein